MTWLVLEGFHDSAAKCIVVKLIGNVIVSIIKVNKTQINVKNQ